MSLPLTSCRNVLQWTDVLPLEESANILKRIATIAMAVVLILSMVTVTPSIAYFWKYISTDIEGCLFALFQISVMFGTINAVISVLFFRHEIVEMFTSLSRIYDEREMNFGCYLSLFDCNSFIFPDREKKTFQCLTQANDRSELVARIYVKFNIVVTLGSLILTPALSVVLCFVINGRFEVTSVYHPFRLV